LPEIDCQDGIRSDCLAFFVGDNEAGGGEGHEGTAKTARRCGKRSDGRSLKRVAEELSRRDFRRAKSAEPVAFASRSNVFQANILKQIDQHFARFLTVLLVDDPGCIGVLTFDRVDNGGMRLV